MTARRCAALTTSTLVLLLFVVALVNTAYAQSYSILYAITHDGFLLQIDTSKSMPTIVPIRAQLGSQFRDIRGLTYRNGEFFASYIVNRSSSLREGHVVKFGFTQGDEVDLGYTGYRWIEGIATAPDGKIYVLVAPQGGAFQPNASLPVTFRPKGLGELNTTTGAVINAVIPPIVAGRDVPELFFDTQGALRAMHWQRGGEFTYPPSIPMSCTGSTNATLDTHDLSTFADLGAAHREIVKGLSALTMDPVTGTIYGFVGWHVVMTAGQNYEVMINSKFLRLNEISCPGGDFRLPGEHIATASYEGITGLAAGPVATAVPQQHNYRQIGEKVTVTF